VAERLLPAELAVDPDPGVALGTDVLDLLDGRINASRGPHRTTNHTAQYRHQADGGHPHQHTAPGIHRPGPAGCVINSHDGSLPDATHRFMRRVAVEHMGTIDR
jgi:hypothetical protein